jgi:hypothetical protein
LGILKRKIRRLFDIILTVYFSARPRIRTTPINARVQNILTPPSTNKLIELIDKNKSYRCIIIGTGPSLRRNKAILHAFKHHVYVNKAFRVLSESTDRDTISYLVLTNKHAFEEYGLAEILNRSEQYKYIFLSSELPHIKTPDDNVIYFSQYEFPRLDHGFVQKDISKPLYHCSTVVSAAIQLTLGMGFKDITLTGVDLRFNQQPGHFIASSTSEIERQHNVSRRYEGRMRRGLYFLMKYCRTTNVKILRIKH